AVEQGDYDLVLMDVMMPGVDGVEATQRIRALPDRRAKLPIIALTADVTPATRDACHNAGMDDYLTKPIDGGALLAMIDRQTTGKILVPATEAAPAAEPADATPDIDLAQLTSIEEVAAPAEFRSLINLFVSTAEERLADLEKIGPSDLNEVRRVAHD